MSTIRYTFAMCLLAGGGFAANSGHAIWAWLMGTVGGAAFSLAVIDAQRAEKAKEKAGSPDLTTSKSDRG